MRLVHYTYPSFRTLVPSLGGLTRSPWSGLENEIDRLFDATVGGASRQTPGRFALDLFEDKANTYVRAELPGLKREDIGVELSDGYLTISATRKGPVVEGREPESVSFSRAVSVAEDIQADKVAATYENGVLTVTLPKAEAVQPKKIEIAVK